MPLWKRFYKNLYIILLVSKFGYENKDRLLPWEFSKTNFVKGLSKKRKSYQDELMKNWHLRTFGLLKAATARSDFSVINLCFLVNTAGLIQDFWLLIFNTGNNTPVLITVSLTNCTHQPINSFLHLNFVTTGPYLVVEISSTVTTCCLHVNWLVIFIKY